VKVGDLVKFRCSGKSNIGLVFNIWKDPTWVELQVKVLWPAGFWTQSIKNLEAINESR
jgi:hypothetical protein